VWRAALERNNAAPQVTRLTLPSVPRADDV